MDVWPWLILLLLSVSLLLLPLDGCLLGNTLLPWKEVLLLRLWGSECGSCWLRATSERGVSALRISCLLSRLRLRVAVGLLLLWCRSSVWCRLTTGGLSGICDGRLLPLLLG